jgi:hypothetical protein
VKIAVGFALALLAWCTWPTGAKSVTDEIDIENQVFIKRYSTRIATEQREKSPAWEGEAENPPVSAKEAKRLATKMKDSLVKDNETYWWGLESLTLRPLSDKWIWVVTFRAHVRKGISTGPATELDIVVMMDGTAIEPQLAR